VDNALTRGIVALLVLTVMGCAVQRGIYHEVRKGQTLWQISRAYDVDLDLILRANRVENARQVQVGTLVFIPGATRQQSVPINRRASRSSSSRNSKGAGVNDRSSGNTGSSATDNSPGKTKRIKPPGTESKNTQSGDFKPVWPCDGRIVSRFDKGGDPTKQGVMMHVSPNSDVKAMEAGTIRLAGRVDDPRELEQFGKLVMVFHNDNFVSVYAHLDKINVNKGDDVSKGEVIGTAGQTGYVDQASCYFQIRYKVKPRDPLLFLGEPA